MSMINNDMSITTSGEKIYLCKENDDLKLTMEGFTLPNHDTSKSFLTFGFELVYDSGDVVYYDGIVSHLALQDATIDGTTITAMLNLNALSAASDPGGYGNIFSLPGKHSNTLVEWYNNNYDGDSNDWQNDGWKSALRIKESRYNFMTSDAVLELNLKNSSNTSVGDWQIWDSGSGSFVPDILNGPNGSSITEDSNFLYTNISNCSSSAGAIGDPHITTFQGDKYTL